MRVSCPSCGATYELTDTLIPAAGTHVQCSACHTRWFARGPRSPVQPVLSEEQILARLESRSRRPRLVPASAPGEPGAVPETAEPDPAPASDDVSAPRDPQEEAEHSADAVAPPRRDAAPAPGGEIASSPATYRPPQAPEDRRAGETASPSVTTLRPRPTSGEAAAPQQPAPAAEPQHETRRGRFGLGLLIVLALGGLGLAAYVEAEALATRVPAAAPYLRDYVRAIDTAREAVEEGLDPLRDALGAG